MPDGIKNPFDEVSRALGGQPQGQKMQAHPTGRGVPPGSFPTFIPGVTPPPVKTAWGTTVQGQAQPDVWGWHTPGNVFMQDPTAIRPYNAGLRQLQSLGNTPPRPLGGPDTDEPPMAFPPGTPLSMGPNKNVLLAALLGQL